MSKYRIIGCFLVFVLIGFAIAKSSKGNAVLVLQKASQDTLLKNDTWYGLTPGTTYKRDPKNPGPSTMRCSRAWSLANEFVNRTTLKQEFCLPASTVSSFSLIDKASEPNLWVVRSKAKESERALILLVDIEKRHIGIIAR